MKTLYKKNKDDLKELYKIFQVIKSLDISNSASEMIIEKDTKKTYFCHSVWIGKNKCYFTSKLVQWLKKNGIIEVENGIIEVEEE